VPASSRDRRLSCRASPCSSVPVARSFSRLVSPNPVGRPTFPRPPIQVSARLGRPSLAGSAPGTLSKRPCNRPRLQHRPAHRHPPGLRSPPSGPPPGSVRVRPCPSGRRGRAAPSPAGEGAGGSPRQSRLSCRKLLKTLDLCPVYAYTFNVGFRPQPRGLQPRQTKRGPVER